MIYNVVEFDQFMTRFQQSSDQQISVTDKHHSTQCETERLFQFHQLIFSSNFTAPAWQGRPWWARALPSSGCPRSVSSWTASRTCGKTGACAASYARQTGKEGDRWFYFSPCIWSRQIIVTDLILFCKSFIATLLGAFVVGAVLPRQVPPYKDQSWWIETSQYGTTIDQWSETQYQCQSWLIETYQYCTTLDRW